MAGDYGRSKYKVVGKLKQFLLFTYDSVAVLITLSACIVLIMSYFAPIVRPTSVIMFSFLGLGFPFIYAFCVLTALYWILRWRIWAVVPLLVCVIGIGHITKYYKPSFSKNYSDQVDVNSLRVMSFNVRGFYDIAGGKMHSSLNDVLDYVVMVDPDIICFQEYEIDGMYSKFQLDQKLAKWKYYHVSITVGSDENNGWGLATYSKYPISHKGKMLYPESSNSSMWTDIVVHRDTIRVFNNHLQTTQINEHDKKMFSTYDSIVGSKLDSKVFGVLRKLKHSFEVRANQVDSVSMQIHNGRGNVIVCGDFNDTPMSYAYNTMKGDFADSFKEKGRGLVYTYNGFYSLFRIDYILHSRDMQTLSYRTEVKPWSDHNPVIVDILPNYKKRPKR